MLEIEHNGNLAPEFGDLSTLDYSRPGYSAEFLKILNEHPAILKVDIRTSSAQVRHATDSGAKYLAEHHPELPEQDMVYVESRNIEGFLISSLWQEIVDWQRQNGAKFGLLTGRNLRPLRGEYDFKKKFPDFEQRTVEVQELVKIFEDYLTEAWSSNMRKKITIPRYQNDPYVRAFARLEMLFRRKIDFAAKRLTPFEGDPEIGKRLNHTVDQGRQITWTLFVTAVKKCEQIYTALSAEASRLKKQAAVISARSLAFSLASSQAQVAKTIVDYLNPQQRTFGNSNGYDLSRFRLLESGDKIYTELDPGIFPDLIRKITELANANPMSAQTGCPAVFALDKSKRNIISAYYDNNAECFMKYCLD